MLEGNKGILLRGADWQIKKRGAAALQRDWMRSQIDVVSERVYSHVGIAYMRRACVRKRRIVML